MVLQFRHNTGDRISIRMANVKTLHSKLKRNQKMKNLGGMGVCMVGRGRGWRQRNTRIKITVLAETKPVRYHLVIVRNVACIDWLSNENCGGSVAVLCDCSRPLGEPISFLLFTRVPASPRSMPIDG